MATTTINIKDELLNNIKLRADANDRSVSAEISYRCKLAIKFERELIDMYDKELGINDVAVT